ncbi:MAG TPA: amino acid permease [Cyclobacteriaceae bacterium]|nr:amino acid permease [Cyclobacteriaceae bacterium]
MSNTNFKPVLGLWDATMIVAGSMIGSGIFIVSADIMRNVGSAGWLIGVWAITGFMTITAAVSYGELSGMYPKAGGQYVYLKEAYNSLMAFLYGWSFFAVIQTATIAAVAVAFSRFTAYLIPQVGENVVLFSPFGLNISAAQLLGIAMIALLTYTNTRGIQGGKIIQNTFTGAKLIALFGLIVLGFILTKENFWAQNWQTGLHSMQDLGVNGGGKTPTGWIEIGGLALLGAIAASMTGSLFSSDAWNNVTFIAGEIKNPKRNIGLSLFLGTLIVTVLYITANLMYLYVLPIDGIAYPQADRLAISAANQIFGDGGKFVIAVLIMISTFGCNNGLILAGARVYYTMALDGLFLKKAGTLNQNAVPQWALWAQAIVASILCLSGEYGNLLDMVSFVVVIFYAMTIGGIFILRKKRPDIERPYKAFAYPVLPAIYILMAATFCIFLVWMKPAYTVAGLIITLIGIPIYYWAMRNKKEAA